MTQVPALQNADKAEVRNNSSVAQQGKMLGLRDRC